MKPFGYVSAACRTHGISRRTYYTRLEKGWTSEEALGLQERRHNWQTVDHAAVSQLLRQWKRP